MKKGQFVSTGELLKMLPRLLILILIVGVIIAIIGIYSSKDIDTIDLEGHLLKQRLLYSKDCLVYEEEGKFFVGVVDLEQFKQDIVIPCVSYLGDKGYKLTLEDSGGLGLADEIIYNQEMIDYAPLCKFEEDKRSFECYQKRQYVLVERDGTFVPGYLNITLVTLNE